MKHYSSYSLIKHVVIKKLSTLSPMTECLSRTKVIVDHGSELSYNHLTSATISASRKHTPLEWEARWRQRESLNQASSMSIILIWRPYCIHRSILWRPKEESSASSDRHECTTSQGIWSVQGWSRESLTSCHILPECFLVATLAHWASLSVNTMKVGRQ